MPATTRVTVKGQVTIPKPVRDYLQIEPGSEVMFVREKETVYLVKPKAPKPALKAPKDWNPRLRRAVGKLKGGMSTDELMQLTRGEP